MRDEIMQELYKTFKLSNRQGMGGMTFKYVPNEDVITRMNKVFKGNWSTTTQHMDVIEDQVLVEVQVTVVDPDTSESYVQTGFGSSQIARYNSGANKGKIIDIGNAYKGSLSKAIVNACTRWGVGLVKESNPYASGDMASEEVVVMPALPSTALATSGMPIPVAPTMPAAPIPVVPAAPAAPTTATPVIAPPSITAAPEFVPPPAMPAPAVVETTTTFGTPMAPEQPVSANIVIEQSVIEMPKVPAPATAAPAVPPTPDLPFSNSEGLGGIGISDVQRVALNGILTMNNADYTELATEAFSANAIDKPIPNKEDLNYDEAVVVIKFGNDKYRKNR